MMLGINFMFAQNADNNIRIDIERTDTFRLKSAEFGVNLFKKAAKKFNDESFILSPFGAQISLSMVGNLSLPASAQNISKIFGYDNIGELNKSNSSVISLLTAPTGIANFAPTKIANGVWFNSGVRHNTTQSIRKYYNAEISHGSLSSSAQRKAINSWIRNSTEGAISDMNFAIPNGTAIIIQTLLYFKQQWDGDYHFSETYTSSFSTARGSRDQNFMDAEIEAPYFKNDEFESVILKLTGYHIICITPVERNLNELIRDIDVDALQKNLREANQRCINLSLPKFKINSDIPLIPLFEGNGTDLASGIASNKTLAPTDIQIDQLSNINVTQIGVAAGSITSATVIVSATIMEDPIDLKFNKPFIFFIIDPATQAILFAGQYTGPEE